MSTPASWGGPLTHTHTPTRAEHHGVVSTPHEYSDTHEMRGAEMEVSSVGVPLRPEQSNIPNSELCPGHELTKVGELLYNGREPHVQLARAIGDQTNIGGRNRLTKRLVTKQQNNTHTHTHT